MLHEEIGGLAGARHEVRLLARLHLRAERRICADDVHPVVVRDGGWILRERTAEADVGRLQSVQDAVHLRGDVGERLHFAAVEGMLLQGLPLVGGVRAVFVHVVERLADEPRRSACVVVELLAELRVEDTDHHADQRTRRVVLPAVASGVAHFAKTALVEDAQLVAVLVGLELERLDEVDHLAQRVAAREAARQFREDATDAVLDGIDAFRFVAQRLESREERSLDEIEKRVALQGAFKVEGAVWLYRPCPLAPRKFLGQGGHIGSTLHFGLKLAVLLLRVKVAEKEKPAGLLHVFERA